MEKTVFLTDMAWPEVKARLPKVRLAILPTGSMEQHGPHLTFETDIAIATELARRLALQQYPHVVVAPPRPVGMSSHHRNFRGRSPGDTTVFFKKAGEFVEAFMVDKTRGAGKKRSAKRP